VRDDDPTSLPPSPRSTGRIGVGRALSKYWPLTLALIVPATCWAVASISPWLVPGYLLLIVATVYSPDHRSVPRRANESSDGLDDSRVDRPPSTDEASDPESAVGTQESREGADSASGEATAVEAATTKTRRGRGRSRAKSRTAPEPNPATWVQVAPGKFVRVEGPGAVPPGLAVEATKTADEVAGEVVSEGAESPAEPIVEQLTALETGYGSTEDVPRSEMSAEPLAQEPVASKRERSTEPFTLGEIDLTLVGQTTYLPNPSESDLEAFEEAGSPDQRGTSLANDDDLQPIRQGETPAEPLPTARQALCPHVPSDRQREVASSNDDRDEDHEGSAEAEDDAEQGAAEGFATRDESGNEEAPVRDDDTPVEVQQESGPSGAEEAASHEGRRQEDDPWIAAHKEDALSGQAEVEPSDSDLQGMPRRFGTSAHSSARVHDPRRFRSRSLVLRQGMSRSSIPRDAGRSRRLGRNYSPRAPPTKCIGRGQMSW
jgi:hypothetical protein